MADGVSVRIVGVAALRKALRDVDKNLDKAFAATLLGVAQGIATKIRGVMPRRSGAAAGTVTAHVRARGASISIGTGNSDDYVPWLDFGGHVGRQNSVYRTFIKEGRYLYPQIMAARKNTLAAVDAAIAQAVEQAGFTTSGKGD